MWISVPSEWVLRSASWSNPEIRPRLGVLTGVFVYLLRFVEGIALCEGCWRFPVEGVKGSTSKSATMIESDSEDLILLTRVRLGSVEAGVFGVERPDRRREEPRDKVEASAAACATPAVERLGDRRGAMGSSRLVSSIIMVVRPGVPVEGAERAA